MKNDDLDVLIKQAGLPPSRYKNKPDKLKITTYLFAETQQELKELVEEKMGPDFHTKVVRMQASGDGSCARNRATKTKPFAQTMPHMGFTQTLCGFQLIIRSEATILCRTSPVVMTIKELSFVRSMPTLHTFSLGEPEDPSESS